MSEMEVKDLEEGLLEGGQDYPLLVTRDHRTSGCSSVAGHLALMHTRSQQQDGSTTSNSDKGSVVNGLTATRRSGDGEHRRMVDITRDKPIKVTVRIMVPVRDHPKFNFVGKLLGPKGNSLKRLQEDTMTKMAILGRGSMRDKHKEEELRLSRDPKFSHLNDELHVEVTAFAPPAEAHARIAYALAEVRRFLVPDYNDEIRQEQMWEMQILNTQRKPGALINDLLSPDQQSSGSVTSSDSRTGSLSPSSPPPGAEALPPAELHPALRGAADNRQPIGSTGVCRKRPLLAAAGTRLAMSPTKRTVLSILARARAAQAKDLNDYQSGGNSISLLRDDGLSGGNLA